MSAPLAARDVRSGEKYEAVTAAPLLNFAGKPIGVIEIALDVSNMVGRSQHALEIFAGAAGIAVLLGLIVSRALARGIGRPIREITAAMRGLADGKLDLSVPHGTRHDEVGVMAGTLEVFRKGLVERRNLEAEAAEQRQAADRQRLPIEDERRKCRSASESRRGTGDGDQGAGRRPDKACRGRPDGTHDRGLHRLLSADQG